MAPQHSARRGPSFRFGLRAFLLLAGIAAPILAFLYWSFLADEIWTNGAGVQTGDPLVPRVVVNMGFAHPRIGNRKDEVLWIIVRPGPNTVPIDETRSASEAPRPEGISVRGGNVFVHGKKVAIKQFPCFLVYQAQARSLVEIGFDKKYNRITDTGSVVNIPEWRSGVIPVLQSSQRVPNDP